MFQYITAQGLQNLQTYQYKGQNNSIFYKLFLKRIATFFIQYTPKSIAANVITLTGLVLMGLGYWLTWAYNPNMEENKLPAFVPFLCAVFLFLYQTLDNMDGLQARRTGTSSPLGQLFDHGCDALNVTITAAIFANVIQLDPRWGTLLVLFSQAVFFVATWDEYHTKEMYLSMINGADEGLVFTQSMMLLTAFYPDLWLFEVHGLTVNRWLVIAQFFGMIATVFEFVQRVRICSEVRTNGMMSALTLTLPFVMSTYCTFVYLDISFSLEAASLEFSPMMFYLCLGMVFAQYTGILIISHVCKMGYSPLQPSVLVLVFLVVSSFAMKFPSLNGMSTYFLNLSLATVIATLMWFHYSFVCVTTIARALNVPIFTMMYTASLPV